MNDKSKKQQVEQDSIYEKLLDNEEIQNRIKELGAQISEDYRGKCPIFIGVLNGGFIFLADLFRAVDIDCEVDFIKISSYEDQTYSKGWVKLLKDVDCEIEGRDILIVEDIVDSGLSIQFLRTRLNKLKPKSVKYVSLLLKEGAGKVEYKVDYVGFKIPNRFVVGYGLDDAQLLRNLPDVYIQDI